MNNTESGFIAIISVVIIGALLMAVTFSLSTRSFFARINSTDSESQEQSLLLAQTCAERARLTLATNPTYTGQQTLMINGNPCQILTIVASGSYSVIGTSARSGFAATTLATTIDSRTSALVFWQQLP